MLWYRVGNESIMFGSKNSDNIWKYVGRYNIMDFLFCKFWSNFQAASSNTEINIPKKNKKKTTRVYQVELISKWYVDDGTNSQDQDNNCLILYRLHWFIYYISEGIVSLYYFGGGGEWC